MNPLYKSMNNSNLAQVSELAKSLKGKNPLALLSTMAQKNPELQPILTAIQCGKNPQKVFMEECAKRGLDANQVLSQVKGLMK